MKCFFNTTLTAPITSHPFKMSEYISCEEIERKLSLVVRKPQTGKTTICIAFIMKSIAEDKRTNVVNIVITMNTLTASSQFIGRLKNDDMNKDNIDPKKIIVFNSAKKTAGDCLYASTADAVKKLIIKQDIKVIVCCAHVNKIRENIPDIFELALNDNRIKSKNIHFIIHIDEAHKYIPENIKSIREFNESPIVSDIIGYSATPDKIWRDRSDTLFHKILIRDVEKELSIMRSDHYFGVKNCNMHVCSEDVTHDYLVSLTPIRIPDDIISEAHKKDPKHNGDKQPRDEWYAEKFPFSLGNERLMLGYLTHILPTLPIDPNCFSYNFAPSYTCKVTHYQCMELILHYWPKANVIVSNGNGFELFRKNDASGKNKLVINSHTIAEELKNEIELHDLCEPAYMVEKLIEKTRNCPTFVTGFMCVQMSVTLINPAIGNFHNVIMSHPHLSRDDGYQMCRFLFNYERWTLEQIATTKRITNFYSLTQKFIDQCLEYEEHDERITTEFAGRTCSLREIQGLEPEEPTAKEIEEQEKEEAFRAIECKNENVWKKFKVYDGNDAIVWENAQSFYESIRGKRISGNSMPTKVDGFYECAISGKQGVQLEPDLKKITNSTEKWSSRFQLTQDQLSYAHVFIGYDNLEDPTEYTIFIKFVELVDTPSTREYLAKYHSKNKVESRTVSTVSAATSQEEEGAAGGGGPSHK